MTTALRIGLVLIVVGILVQQFVALEVRPRRAKVTPQQAEDTDLTLAFISAIRDPLPGSVPCMEMQPVGAPLICGRGVAHRGHHIAFGNGHRIIATWPAGPRMRSVPVQREGGAS